MCFFHLYFSFYNWEFHNTKYILFNISKPLNCIPEEIFLFVCFTISKNRGRIKLLGSGLGKDLIWIKGRIYILQLLAHSRISTWITSVSHQGLHRWLCEGSGNKTEFHMANHVARRVGHPLYVGKGLGFKQWSQQQELLRNNSWEITWTGPQVQISK